MSRTLNFVGGSEADELQAEDPFAFVDRRASRSAGADGIRPRGAVAELDRLGDLKVASVADTDPNEFTAFREQNLAVPWCPGPMAQRIQGFAAYRASTTTVSRRKSGPATIPTARRSAQATQSAPGIHRSEGHSSFSRCRASRWASCRTGAARSRERTATTVRIDVVDEKSLFEEREFERAAKGAARTVDRPGLSR